MRKVVVIALCIILFSLNLQASSYQSIKYKTSNNISWSTELPKEEDSVLVSIDNGDEIETEIIHINGYARDYQVKWSWLSDNEADSYKYRVNEGAWTTVSDSEIYLNAKDFAKKKFNLFEVCSVGNNVESAIGKRGLIVVENNPYRYPFSIRFGFSPISVAAFDFFNGHSIPDAKYLTLSQYGLSTDLDFGYYLTDGIKIYLGAGYSYVKKVDTVIPDAKAIHYIKTLGGFDFTIVNSGKASLASGLFGGCMFHFNAGKCSISSLMGARLDFNFDLGNNIMLSAGTKLTAMYLPSKQNLLKSMTYLIDPITVSMEVRF